ncbi:MAG TPA: hypothetical protein VF972_06160, partial [Actinomycetota bacterium]
MAERVVIERRFQSWDGVAHGGYVAGLVGGRLGPASEVTLRQAAPFDVPLAIEQDDGHVALTFDGGVIARAA